MDDTQKPEAPKVDNLLKELDERKDCDRCSKYKMRVNELLSDCDLLQHQLSAAQKEIVEWKNKWLELGQDLSAEPAKRSRKAEGSDDQRKA